MSKEWLVVIMNGDIRFRYEVEAKTKGEAIKLAQNRAIAIGNEYENIVHVGENDWLSREPYCGCCPE